MTRRWNRWPEGSEELLTQLWAKGLSGATIARMMGGGLKRNAVIGKAHRLKLARRAPSPSGLPPQTREQFNARRRARHAEKRVSAGYAPPHTRFNGMKPRLLKAPHAPPVAIVAYAGEPQLITDLPNRKGCRYAVTETTPFKFCGAPGYPWCEYHQAVVWRPV